MINIETAIGTLGCAEHDAAAVDFIYALQDEPLVDRDEEGSYYTFPRIGIELSFSAERRLVAVFFKNIGIRGEEPIASYEGELPEAIEFGMSREEVWRSIGMPSESAEAKNDLGVQIYPWDIYNRERYRLHIRYALDCRAIMRVAICALD